MPEAVRPFVSPSEAGNTIEPDLKERFFEHLGDLGEKAQFIVVEKVDPPEGIETYALVEAFTGDPDVPAGGMGDMDF